MFDFYSDAKTIPSRAMREAALDAEVGDEQKGEDPTTLSLCHRVADMLGHEDAILMPSGTMCNEVAAWIMCPRGETLICERGSHIVNFEAGGVAALAGAQVQALDGERGMLTVDDIDHALKHTGKTGLYPPRPAMLSLEQTTNLGGGAVWPLEQLAAVANHGRTRGLATYLDGARLFNASVKSGVPLKAYGSLFDAVGVDFTKGLGCGFGAVLAGSRAFVEKAWRVRQMFGGGLRQSGIQTAMMHYALDHNVGQLAKDHAVAASIGNALAEMALVESVKPVETNIVIFQITSDGPLAVDLVVFAKERGFKIGAFGERTVRIVTHLGVDAVAGCQLVEHLREPLERRTELPRAS